MLLPPILYILNPTLNSVADPWLPTERESPRQRRATVLLSHEECVRQKKRKTTAWRPFLQCLSQMTRSRRPVTCSMSRTFETSNDPATVVHAPACQPGSHLIDLRKHVWRQPGLQVGHAVRLFVQWQHLARFCVTVAERRHETKA